MFSKIYHAIFNQAVYKFLLAISIPAGIMGFWLFSLQESKKLIIQSDKEMNAHPMTEQTTVDNYELKEIDDANNVKWQLRAERGVMTSDGSNDVLLKKVLMKYYDGKILKMSISAPSGIANQTTHIVKLSSDDKQRVIAENGTNHGRLEASKVELNKKNQFVATGGVNIVLPGVAKVTGNTATGALEKDSELKNFKIIGNTHAIIGS